MTTFQLQILIANLFFIASLTSNKNTGWLLLLGWFWVVLSLISLFFHA